ncbi:phosphate acetyltransferase [Candidatus Peregrinibacteria bacterium]|nr:phosphate acetyltransferase [Candidatus Peregrinibacteria bacterium]
MKKFIKRIKKEAASNPKTIVFPDALEERTLTAASKIQRKGYAKVVLIGPKNHIKDMASSLKLKFDWKNIRIEDPKNSKLRKTFIKKFYELRKHKGISKEDAAQRMLDRNYFGTMMVETNEVDGMVTGTISSTADSIRPALQIIKTKEKFHKVSGVYFMILEKRILLFADTAVTIDPNSHDLADIAIDTAHTAKIFGIHPRVALLSFSTKGSASHPVIDKVREAVAIIKSKKPDLIVDGELQIDAALVKQVAQKKCPSSPIQGNANVLIFPNLESGNIAYKLVERLAKAKAIGPMLQGLRKPVNDLSRGCSAGDIVNITAFTVVNCCK